MRLLDYHSTKSEIIRLFGIDTRLKMHAGVNCLKTVNMVRPDEQPADDYHFSVLTTSWGAKRAGEGYSLFATQLLRRCLEMRDKPVDFRRHSVTGTFTPIKSRPLVRPPFTVAACRGLLVSHAMYY